MGSISLLDILHSVDFLPVLYLIDPKDIVSLGLISKIFRQCLETSVKWGSYLKKTEHCYCSMPLNPIADSYEQYVAATQTIFIHTFRQYERMPILCAVHRHSTLIKFLAYWCNLRRTTLQRIDAYYGKNCAKKYAKISGDDPQYRFNEIFCSDIFVPGAHLGIAERESGIFIEEFGCFGTGFYKWSSSSGDKFEIIPTPYYQKFDLRFSSYFIKSLLDGSEPNFSQEIDTVFPHIKSYLVSGRRWILSKSHHIYWIDNEESPNTERRTRFCRSLSEGVSLGGIVLQFEHVLASKYSHLQEMEYSFAYPLTYLFENVQGVYEMEREYGMSDNLPGFDRMFHERVVFGYDVNGFTLCCGSIQVSPRFSTLRNVFNCLAAMARFKRRKLELPFPSAKLKPWYRDLYSNDH